MRGVSPLARLFASGAVLLTLAPDLALAAPPTAVQEKQTRAVGEIPHCDHKVGTVSIANGDNPTGWQQFDLAPPEKLLRVIVQKSGCFGIVDRAAGLAAAQQERDINNSGLGLQRGSNVGQNQIKAADYVLVAEVQAQNANASGGGAAAAVGGLIGGRVGGLVGGIRTRKLEANVVLTLNNVRTTETVATDDGYAAKTDIGWSAGGGAGGWGGFGGAVGGGYENTDIGRIVTLAFIDAYAKMVNDVGGLQPGAAQQAPQRSFSVIATAAMHKTADAKGAVVRQLTPGMTVYPTGNKDGLWWEVADDNDNVGWVLNTKLAPK